MKKCFIDTNVWFSAFYGSRNCETILKMHINDKIEAVMSQTVLGELVHNIEKKVPQALKPLSMLLENTPPMIVVDQVSSQAEFAKYAHAKDSLILASALLSKCEYLITGNVKDFSADDIQNEFGLLVVTPGVFLKEAKS